MFFFNGSKMLKKPLNMNLCIASLRQMNSSPPSAAYMSLWTGPAMVQVMACRLFGVKPLPEPMPTYCQLGPQEHTSVQFE